MKTTELETAELPQLIPGRACGTCMMCCKVPAIEEFAKPPGVWCKHAVSGRGCGIYAERPGSEARKGEVRGLRAAKRRQPSGRRRPELSQCVDETALPGAHPSVGGRW